MAASHPRAEPFRAALDIAALGDLALRLGAARLGPVWLGSAGLGPAGLPADGGTWERGVPADWLARLIGDWRSFDPLALQARLDRLTHLRAEVGGLAVHLVHARGTGAERYFRVSHWAEHDRGGHFPAVAEPHLLADRLREVFRPCRGS